ncbi:hypothetical protein ACFLSG_00785 [Candidatus Bipolaricaulota bacterium]
MGQLLLTNALEIETSRAHELADFLDSDYWDAVQHLEALQATYRALARSLDEPQSEDRDPASEARPRRTLQGPVRYSMRQELPKDDRDFLNEKLSSHHGAPQQILVNLADGMRTVSEITACLSLDFQRVFEVDDIQRAVDLLEQVGYLST